jgi:hypothetical protein
MQKSTRIILLFPKFEWKKKARYSMEWDGVRSIISYFKEFNYGIVFTIPFHPACQSKHNLGIVLAIPSSSQGKGAIVSWFAL